MKDYKKRIVDYAEWGWGRSVPYFCPTAFHHETELIRPICGDGEIYINGERFVLKKGDLYIVRPMTLHSIRKTGDVAPIVDYVKFDLRILAENCPQNGKIGDYLHFFNDKTAPCVVYGDSIRYNAERITAPLFADGLPKEETQKAVFGLLKLLHEHRNSMHVSNITEERQHFAAQKAAEYITGNFNKQVRVAEIAKLVGYDEYYTMKLFKKFCGWSIVEYLNGVRVTEAYKLLTQTDEDVNAVAKKVGYNSASYFNRQFKKTFGQTPCQLREQTV